MRLSRQKAFLLLLVSSIACSDSTGPETVSAFFTLRTIDGRALPTYVATTPGPTSTIISSTLKFDKTGSAVIVEHRDDMFRGDVTDTTTYGYSIHGNQIEMGSICVAITTCPFRTGTLSLLGLSVVINPSSPDSHIVYQYLKLALD
jgi:hypothetical protein